MKLGDVKRQALMLLQEWFNNGQKQPEADIADYLYSMDDFADTAQKQIAAKRPIFDTFNIEQKEEEMQQINRHILPNTFYRIDKVMYESDDVYTEFHNYQWEGRNTLLLPAIAGKFVVHYKRMPETIQFSETDPNKNDDIELEIDYDVQYLVPMYCAAMAILPEEPTIGTMKLNEYYGQLNGLDDFVKPGQAFIKNVTGW